MQATESQRLKEEEEGEVTQEVFTRICVYTLYGICTHSLYRLYVCIDMMALYIRNFAISLYIHTSSTVNSLITYSP